MPSRICTEKIIYLESKFLSKGLRPLLCLGLSPKGTTRASDFHELLLAGKLGFSVDAQLAVFLHLPDVRKGCFANVDEAVGHQQLGGGVLRCVESGLGQDPVHPQFATRRTGDELRAELDKRSVFDDFGGEKQTWLTK